MRPAQGGQEGPNTIRTVTVACIQLWHDHPQSWRNAVQAHPPTKE
jgi:hypothetical protein